MTNPADLTAVQAIRMIHDGMLNPMDLAEAYIDRIAEREPALQAFAYFNADRVREAARNAKPGPLQGIPIGVKDVLDTADMPSQ
jgi:Asp-tRNA(Asn)/Glu-tRNA(Gln) amidotransferase A subunit family amidase